MNIIEKIKSFDVQAKQKATEFALVTVGFSLISLMIKLVVQSYKLQVWRIHGAHDLANWFIFKHGVAALILLSLLVTLLVTSDKIKKELQFRNEIEEI